MLIHNIQPVLSPKFQESLKLDTADVTVYHLSNRGHRSSCLTTQKTASSATDWNEHRTGDYSFPGSAWERIGVEAPASRVHKLRMHFGEAELRVQQNLQSVPLAPKRNKQWRYTMLAMARAMADRRVACWSQFTMVKLLVFWCDSILKTNLNGRLSRCYVAN